MNRLKQAQLWRERQARIANLPQCLSLFHIGIYFEFYFPYKLDSERSSFFPESHAPRVKKLVNEGENVLLALPPSFLAALILPLFPHSFSRFTVTKNNNKRLLAVYIQIPSIIYHRLGHLRGQGKVHERQNMAFNFFAPIFPPAQAFPQGA